MTVLLDAKIFNDYASKLNVRVLDNLRMPKLQTS